jgi:hypothetical protein
MNRLREYIRKNVTHLPKGGVDWFFIFIALSTVITGIILIVSVFKEGIL